MSDSVCKVINISSVNTERTDSTEMKQQSRGWGHCYIQ